jgi:hypothetical protein
LLADKARLAKLKSYPLVATATFTGIPWDMAGWLCANVYWSRVNLLGVEVREVESGSSAPLPLDGLHVAAAPRDDEMLQMRCAPPATLALQPHLQSRR